MLRQRTSEADFPAIPPVHALQFAAQGIMAASSRMLFAFARDNGLPFAKFFSKNNPRTGVPDRTVIFTAVWCIIFSLVYLVRLSVRSA